MNGRELPEDVFSDDDASYRESSADSDDDLPMTMARDRAQWVVDNQDAVEDLYRAFKETGKQLFGEAFFQCGNITPFAHFVYKYTMPGATEPP
jgi:hypothetical protein